jgi:hypothetical protein
MRDVSEEVVDIIKTHILYYVQELFLKIMPCMICGKIL